MPLSTPFEIFAVVQPGLEDVLAAEMRACGFADPVVQPGGVAITGGWPDVWRANLQLRGATRILARIDTFRAVHLSQLDKHVRRMPWQTLLKPGIAVRVDATCRKSKIYHAGAVAQRVGDAISDIAGAPVEADAALRVMARIDDNVCTLSIDTSGEMLHRRGHKQAVNRAPMRETLAALFLRACGYDGSETVLDPMCGSGTFVIEAAEIASGLAAGRARSFAFEALAGFDADAWQALRASLAPRSHDLIFHGSDRDPGAVRMSRENAERAGVAGMSRFTQTDIADLVPPDTGAPGLVIVNPPYGGRIGNRKALYGVYAALGASLARRFSGWRVGLVTSDAALARATRLPFGPPGRPVDHGGIKIRLYVTGALR